MKPAKTVTLNDVARASGVSHQTVSRVVNGSEKVAAATRARVLQAVADLGYRPNRVARQLVTGRAETVGIISFGTSYYGPAMMVGSVEGALKRRGYGFVFASTDSLELDSIRKAVEELERHPIAGLILVTPLLNVRLAEVQALCQNVPFVLIDVQKGADLPSVLIDQAEGGALATRHLLELGHERICEISGPLTWCDAQQRHRAWLDTVAQAGLTPGRSLESDWTARGGYEAAQRLRHETFSALVVGNDQMALGALAALHERGLRVPEDVSVVGFDDVPEARYYSPPLSTVRQDFETLGRESVAYILGLIEQTPAPSLQRVLSPTLVVRSSTGPVR